MIKKSTLTLLCKGGDQENIKETESYSDSNISHQFVYREPSEMKDSGIEWIGKTYNNWNTVKLKFLVNYVKGYAFKTELFRDLGIPIVKASDIKNFTIRQGKDFLSEEDSMKFNNVKLKENDLIVSTVGSNPDVIASAVGQVAKVPKEFNNSYLNQNTVKIFSEESKSLKNNFLFYILISNPYRKYIDLYAHGTANQASLNIEDMLSFYILKPNLKEQTKIANFLDQKTSEFDNMISKKERIINKLEEAKKSLISETVTGKVKIVNNEIIQRDKSEMKDSGIEWIGFIPKDWKVKRLKHLSNILFSNVDKKSFDDEKDVLLCNYMDVYKNNFITNKLEFMKATATNNEIEKFKINEGDVIVTKDSETPEDIANSALVTENLGGVICGYHLALIRPTKIIGSYLYRLFNSVDFQKRFVISAKGVTRFGLSQSSFNNIETLLPSLEEQTKISNFLDQKTSEFDNLIEKQKRIIKKIKEAKQSLISEAVTGKIKII